LLGSRRGSVALRYITIGAAARSAGWLAKYTDDAYHYDYCARPHHEARREKDEGPLGGSASVGGVARPGRVAAMSAVVVGPWPGSIAPSDDPFACLLKWAAEFETAPERGDQVELPPVEQRQLAGALRLVEDRCRRESRDASRLDELRAGLGWRQ
jgi:hypothetical protein